MKVAFVNRRDYGLYFAEKLRQIAEVYIYDHYNQIGNPAEYDCIFIEYIGMDAIEASKTKHKKLVVRTHGIEIYQTNCDEVNWENVDLLLTMGNHQKEYFEKRWKGRPKSYGVLPCIAMPEKFTFRNEKNNRVACVGNITGRKGEDTIPDFLLEYPDKEVYHLGEVCLYGYSVDEFVKWRVKRDKTEDRYHYQTKIDFADMDKWLEDKSYIWLPSIAEGFPRTIIEGMLKGLCPIIRRYEGAVESFGTDWTYDNLDDIQRIFDMEYEPEKYRDWILSKTGFDSQIETIKRIIG